MVEPVVKVEALTKSFAQARRSLLVAKEEAARGQDVSVDISRGEAFGIIGESGLRKIHFGAHAGRPSRPR